MVGKMVDYLVYLIVVLKVVKKVAQTDLQMVGQ